MSVKDRQYNRQNLSRAIPHVDQIQEYIDRVGDNFYKAAAEHYGTPENWPDTYKSVFEGLTLLTELCTQQKALLQQIHDGI